MLFQDRLASLLKGPSIPHKWSSCSKTEGSFRSPLLYPRNLCHQICFIRIGKETEYSFSSKALLIYQYKLCYSIMFFRKTCRAEGKVQKRKKKEPLASWKDEVN